MSAVSENNQQPEQDGNYLHRLFSSSLRLQTPAPLKSVHWLLFAAIMVTAILARFLFLDKIPPGLWYDEALYSLDGYSVSQGHMAIFFDRFGHPREPLFPWLLGLAFWLFESTTFVARCVSATCGSLGVAIFFPVARRFFPTRWALGATAAFAVFRWHIHFSRVIFRADLASLMILLAVWMFLRWREKRKRIDAALCGIAITACLYTYISLRIVPVLVVLWIVWMAIRGLLSFRRECKQIALIFGVALVAFLPLAIDYVRHPDHLFGRTDEISMFEKTVHEQLPDGTEKDVQIPKSFSESIGGIAENAWGVARVWFIKGDYVPRHGIPYRPILDPVTGALFALGILICLWRLIRGGSVVSVILLTWFAGFAMASIFSFGAPNILRMQGASPVVILMGTLGLYRLVDAWPQNRGKVVPVFVPVIILLFFATSQLNDYFLVFPNDLRVRSAFGADFFYAPAKAADDIATEMDKVYVPAEFMDAIQVKFITIRRNNIVPYSPDQKLPEPKAGESVAWVTTMRSVSLADEANNSEQMNNLESRPNAKLLRSFTIPQEVESKNGTLTVYNQPWARLWAL